MAYVSVPKDFTKIKPKVLFNLTKRQLVCFGLGALVGVPVFFLLKNYIDSSVAVLVMIGIMLPFFMFAMFEKNGEPLEKYLQHIYQAQFARPKFRPYKTDNFYSLLQKQIDVHEEVKIIAEKAR